MFADEVNEIRRQGSTRGSFAFQLRDACTDSQTVQREHAFGCDGRRDSLRTSGADRPSQA